MKIRQDFEEAVQRAVAECYKEFLAIKRNEINNTLFELRKLADPNLEHAWKRYLPLDIVKKITGENVSKEYVKREYTKEELDEFFAAQSDTPYDEEIAKLRKEAIEWKREQKILAEYKGDALMRYFAHDESHNLLVDFLFGMIKASNGIPHLVTKDWIDEIRSEVILGHGFADKVYQSLENKLKKMDKKTQLTLCWIIGHYTTDDPDEDDLMFSPVAQKTLEIFENEERHGEVLELFLHVEAAGFLRQVLRFHSAWKDIKDVIGNFYDDERYWSYLDREHRKKFFDAIKLRNIDHEVIKELRDEQLSFMERKLTENLKRRCEIVEQSLRKIIKKILIENMGEDWFGKPELREEYKWARERLEGDRTKAPENMPADYLDLTRCKSLIDKEWQFFEPVFVNNSQVFRDRKSLMTALEFIREYRNKVHGTGYRLPYGDDKLLGAYLDKIDACSKQEIRHP